jgi:hypothetical protein
MTLNASARAFAGLLEQMSNCSDSGPDPPMSARVRSPAAGEERQGGHQVKARLYRTAFAVSIVAILLEGLGAGWKWG